MFCNGSTDPKQAKHYPLSDPEKQKLIVLENFTYTWTKDAKYSTWPVWKGATFEQIKLEYEEVPEDEITKYDRGWLAKPDEVDTV